MRTFWRVVAVAGVLCGSAQVAPAHGGNYVGPSGSVPPSQQPPGAPTPPPPPAPTPGPTTGPLGQPGATPLPPGGTTQPPSPTPPRAPSPGARGGARTGLAGSTVQRRRASARASFYDWEFWWGMNKDAFLNLKARLYGRQVASETAEFFFGRRTRGGARDTSRPSPALLRATVIPRLREALKSPHADIRDSACVALGKVGDAREVPVLLGMLRDPQRSVREGAVLGLGLLGVPEAAPPLRALLAGGEEAKALRGREPHYRLRAFAAAALGLLGAAAPETVALLQRLAAEQGLNRNIRVNCVLALGLLKGKGAALTPVRTFLRQRAAQAGEDVWVRAHAVISWGRLLERTGWQPTAAERAWLRRLARRDRSHHVNRSAVLALGRVGRDEEAVRLLRTLLVRAQDLQTRHFAAVSLGRVGGAVALRALQDAVLRGRGQLQAYAALGLGILVREAEATKAPQALALAGRKALREAFQRMKNPSLKAAVGIALGIAQDREAGRLLLRAFRRTTDPQVRGYLAVALGMVDCAEAVPALQAVLREATSMPLLQQHAAIGLGLLGNREIVPALVSALAEARTAYAMGSITKALGFVGDRTALVPLTGLLANEKRPPLVRGFACVALGAIGEPGDLPRLARLAEGHNYLANTEVLNELLDIL